MLREKHKYRYFNCQLNERKEKRSEKTFLTTIKQKRTIKNGALQIAFYQ